MPTCILVVIALLAACGSKADNARSTAPAARPTREAADPMANKCDAVVTHLAVLSASIPVRDQAYYDRANRTMVTACIEDKWPQSYLDCTLAATNTKEAQECAFPHELMDKLYTRMEAELGDKPEQ
jgi:hypothetical protein